MRHIELQRKDIDYKAYVKRGAREEDFSTLITEDAALFEDGKLKLVYKRLPLDEREIVGALKRIKYQSGTRTTGLKSTSRIFGYMPRVTIRQDYCRVAGLAHEQPEEHLIITEYAKLVSDLYAAEDPAMFTIHQKAVEDAVLDEYIIPGTPFTSGIINKNNALKYHFDTGNFKDVYSSMLAFKFNVTGGYLALPEYDVGLEIATNSVTIFDGQKIMHGVTPITYLTPDAYRYTIVYYSLQQMWKCLPITEEVLRIRNLKTTRERKRVAPEETLGEVR
jgi:hypothetical protein